MADERRDIRAVVRTYKDKETGEDKNVYATIGTAWVSEHGSKISLTLETTPVNWDGRAFINKPYQPKDTAPEDISGEPVDLSSVDLPF